MIGVTEVVMSLGSKIIDKFLSSSEDKVKAQAEFMNMLQNGELKELELLVQDRDSARNREVEVKDGANIRIASLILIGFFVTLCILFFSEIQAAMKDTLLLMIGSLGTMATQVVAYYFGSSSGSKSKTDILGARVKKFTADL